MAELVDWVGWWAAIIGLFLASGWLVEHLDH